MARKRRRRRQRTITKIKNIALLGLTFARPISIMMGSGPIEGKVNRILVEASFGVADLQGSPPGFDLKHGAAMYGPPAAALVLNEVAKMALKKFPVR